MAIINMSNKPGHTCTHNYVQSLSFTFLYPGKGFLRVLI